ncbi:UNVERIFIED_CONTAM: hypothetical protein Sindi_1814200 [Sesamum indicum]
MALDLFHLISAIERSASSLGLAAGQPISTIIFLPLSRACVLSVPANWHYLSKNNQNPYVPHACTKNNIQVNVQKQLSSAVDWRRVAARFRRRATRMERSSDDDSGSGARGWKRAGKFRRPAGGGAAAEPRRLRWRATVARQVFTQFPPPSA